MLGRQRQILLELGAFPDPRVRQVFAIAWAVLFWILAVALWQKRPVARRLIPFILLLYGLFELGFARAFVQTPLARDAWLVNGLFYLSMISFVLWALNRSPVKSYFRER